MSTQLLPGEAQKNTNIDIKIYLVPPCLICSAHVNDVKIWLSRANQGDTVVQNDALQPERSVNIMCLSCCKPMQGRFHM